MKNLISYSLDVNISVQSNIVKKKLLDFAVLVIDYYRLIETPTSTESIFLWLNRLSSLAGLSIDPNCTEIKSHNKNCNMDIANDEMFWTEKMSSINPNCTKSKSYDDIYNKSNYNINDKMSGKKPGSNDSKDFINIYNISKVGHELTYIEQMPSTNSNGSKSKDHGDICNKSNYDIGDGVASEKLAFDNLEDFEWLRNIKSI